MSSVLINADTNPLKPGSTYRLVVRSAEEAAQTIRERLGETARVLSVRHMPAPGVGGWFARPKLEVIAQIPEQAPEPVIHAPSSAMMAAGRSLNFSTGVETGDEGSADITSRGRDDRPLVLPDLLRRSGFSSALIGRLEGASPLSGTSRKPLHRALVDVGDFLRQAATLRADRALPVRTAFLGTPGAGRTTALCKWLARDVFVHRRTGRVFKAEFSRPNPTEGLAVFCEALGLSLEHATVDMSLGPASGDFLYMDMPALSVRRPAENRATGRMLDDERIDGRVLVLNAAYDASMLREAYAVGRDLGATHIVFTHLDEISHWGKLWDFLIEGELTPLFLSTGPGLTGDLDADVVGAVLRKTVPGSDCSYLS